MSDAAESSIWWELGEEEVGDGVEEEEQGEEEEGEEEVTKLTSRFLHSGGMAHQVYSLLFFVTLCHL